MIALRYAAVVSMLISTACPAADLGVTLDQELPLLGHRNWIVIADAAYPAQTGAGIETIYVGGDQIDTVAQVLKRIESSKHVRAKVRLDAELKAVPEQDAPGITEYRERLDELLKAYPAERKWPHEANIFEIDSTAKKFRVLILKTDLTIPYTTVFLQLDCRYWSADAEQRLRKSLSPVKTMTPPPPRNRK